MRAGAAHLKRRIRLGTLAALFASVSGPALTEGLPSFNLYGAPGLIDMPSAEMAPDATLGFTYGRIGDSNRGSMIFQITPRLIGTFRYSGIQNFDHPDAVDGVYYDRSFDLRYQIFTETDIRPAIAVGLQDFIGTGLYSGEYVVATKTLSPGLKVSAGLGWGRLASHNPVTTIGTRPAYDVSQEGGTVSYDRWFRGDIAPFGGISYAPNDRLNFTLEYSSDGYDLETRRGGFEHSSPFNFGVDYRFKNDTQLSLYYAHGTTLGAQVTVALNPKTTGIPAGNETGGLPVKPRPQGSASDLGWTTQLAAAEASVQQRLVSSLDREKLLVAGFELQPRSATLRLENPTYGAPAQAIGRAARVMTRIMPDSVEEFTIVPVENGMPMSAITLQRSDLEALENDAAVEMLARTRFRDAVGLAPAPDLSEHPKFTWALTPYYSYSSFDPDNPLRIDLGAELSGSYEITPNVVLSGSVRKKVVGNLDTIERVDESKLPRVRTDYRLYAAEGDPLINRLTLDLYGRPGRNLYSRLSLGYLEQMYAGASAELLWKPVASRLALGAEVNYVRRRDYDGMLGIQENVTIDPVSGIQREIPDVNGHVSAYYAFGNGFHGQVDVGRYLAGDYGATFTVSRQFANGWRVGAFATLTDVSSEEFGEGSFDKGIMLTIPLSVGIGTPTRTTNSTTIRSVQRDGGARLNVSNRLYEQVRTWHEPDVANTWGRFWR
ncbi:YjbH domain-containing protein [Salipiger profundus]|uniref:YjbH domain-containing protein n=1 Tax=Salipiger profundus TaxID=1229727 RepID=UPI0008E3CB4A|nr:YjbH domain-containing protein [Salipiger profundus]SFC64905.1 Exopolysaccharide biosynthesis protein YbjH [Salipiger profundus]